MATKSLAQLGTELDAIENRICAGDRRFATALQHHRARGAYFGALRDKSFIALKHVEQGAYSRGRYDKALRTAEQAKNYLAMINVFDELGACSARELCDAVAAEELAGMIFDALAHKQRWLRDEKKRPAKRRTVSNGRFRTGRYTIVDGIRIPIEKDIE
ncbi:hypothetical protein L6654_24205 [Bradyrhizobium sp. WYCCWR 13023]|uniref:Uncharacterized protein n=1 Tax=Bradyrhizobium zhengyangense TaxID=2911009 RepID=A0A9X1UAC5_9BRAD|nr:hypothetical protein [Bradyrhizobium zhengyangense]MCG2629731.1 hypothetical protein [Bradyrhizobium zhengyangense]